MKQTNKLLNIANILNYVFCLGIFLLVIDVFERYALITATTIISITGISNLIIGIVNIVKGNKKIGIFNIIISAMFIFDAIIINIIDDVDEWMYIAVLICSIVPLVLTILNLIFNRKTSNLNITKKKSILFLLGIIVEIIIIAIPIILYRININNMEKTIRVLENDSSERIVVDTYDGIKIFDLEGNVINSLNYYRLIDTWDIENFNKKTANSSNKKITIIVVKVDDQLWLIDYNGNLIERLYCLFEYKFYIPEKYKTQLKKRGYRNASEGLEGIANSLSLNYHKDNIYKFGNIEENGYQIIVEINENELENDTELLKKIESGYNDQSIYNNLYSNENLRKIKNIYKYKKNYSIITKSGEVKKIDCNNLIFSLNSSGELEIKQYSNKYIPYFDIDSSGFINVNGEKNGFKKDYIVIDTTDKYALVYNPQNNRHYIYIFNNNSVIDLDNYGLRYYDNNYIITYKKFLIVKDNKIINLLYNEDILDNDGLNDHIFINYDKKNKRYVSPYNDIDIYYTEPDEITETNLINDD